MKFVRSSLLVKLVILIVVVYAVVTLVSLRSQIADKNAEAAALTSSITAVEQKNGVYPAARSLHGNGTHFRDRALVRKRHP